MNIENLDEVKELIVKSGILGKDFNCTFNPSEKCVELWSPRGILYEASIARGKLNIYIPMANHDGPGIRDETPYLTKIPQETIKIEKNQ